MKISVVSVTYKRPQQLYWGLMSIIKQEVKPDEIILVDEGDDQETKDISQKLIIEAENRGIDFVYMNTENKSPRISCIPRNLGWRYSKGDWIFFTESECLHVGNTIKQLQNKIKEKPENSHLASQVWTMGERIWKKLQQKDFERPESILNHEYAQLTDSPNTTNTKAPDSDWAITGQSNISAGCLFAVKREYLEEIGGFDESFEGHGFDDFDIYNRLAMTGHGIISHPDITIIHQWHEKKYPYNIYEMAEKNGRISENNVKSGVFKVNT